MLAMCGMLILQWHICASVGPATTWHQRASWNDSRSFGRTWLATVAWTRGVFWSRVRSRRFSSWRSWWRRLQVAYLQLNINSCILQKFSYIILWKFVHWNFMAYAFHAECFNDFPRRQRERRSEWCADGGGWRRWYCWPSFITVHWCPWSRQSRFVELIFLLLTVQWFFSSVFSSR